MKIRISLIRSKYRKISNISLPNISPIITNKNFLPNVSSPNLTVNDRDGGITSPNRKTIAKKTENAINMIF